MMEKLVLLMLISVMYLCDAGRVHLPTLTHSLPTSLNSDGFAVSGSEESEEVIEDMPPCGEIMSSNSGQFRMERVTSAGTNSKYKEFPWMVAVYRTGKDRKQCKLTDSRYWFFIYGGLLIGTKVVLVSGRQLKSFPHDNMKVRAGDWNIDNQEDTSLYQERLVKKIIIHPQYNHSTKARERKYDIALLVVESPFTLADNIAFICLPPPDLNFAAASCKVAGWKVHKRIGNSSYEQSVEDASYIDRDQCQRTFRQYSQPDYVLPDSAVCARVPRGKPWISNHELMCITENHYFARGLSFWSLTKSIYSYMDVVKFRNFIDQTMRANGFPTDTYTHKAYRK